MDAHLVGGLPAPVVTLLGVWGVMLFLTALSHWPKAPVVRVPAKGPHPLKPKTGADCPRCQGPLPLFANSAPHTPIPWSQVRSPRGPKKRSVTEGFACDNAACVYYGITDATVHALIAYAGHGKHERIPDLYCQACKHKATVRRPTALYRLKTPSARVAEALTFLAEGVDVSVLERTWGIGDGTLRAWLTRTGLHAGKLHDHFFQQLKLQHVQLDELWANAR